VPRSPKPDWSRKLAAPVDLGGQVLHTLADVREHLMIRVVVAYTSAPAKLLGCICHLRILARVRVTNSFEVILCTRFTEPPPGGTECRGPILARAVSAQAGTSAAPRH
jgi:hypothetical protein